MNYVKTSGELLIATRLTQLAANFWKNRNLIYQENNVLFKSKWFPVIDLISKRSCLSVNDISNELGFAHTSILQIVKELKEEKYISSTQDKNDARRRVLSLTALGRQELKKNSRIWKAILEVNKEILTDSGLLEAIANVEVRFEEASFYERFKKKMG